VELTHGTYRAQTDADRKRRETFVVELFHAVAAYPLTLEVARLAGRIHGEQMSQGDKRPVFAAEARPVAANYDRPEAAKAAARQPWPNPKDD
jgi:hypothetical protein